MNLIRIAPKIKADLLIRGIFNAAVLSTRNTFIVKRKIPPPLSRIHARLPRILKGKHFIYETVEDTDLTDPPDLHVVLTTFVDGIGDVGDVISVIPQYARDNLLLLKKAEYATPENIEKYSNLKKTRPDRSKFSSIHAGMTVKRLSRSVIPVFMSSEVEWVMQKSHIHVAFRNEGFYVPKDAIEVPVSPIEGPDPVKEAKDFAVFITINNTEKVPVRCRLFYFKLGMETAKLSEDLYLGKEEPILMEQAELLDEMPMPEIVDDPASSISLIEKYRIQHIK